MADESAVIEPSHAEQSRTIFNEAMAAVANDGAQLNEVAPVIEKPVVEKPVVEKPPVEKAKGAFPDEFMGGEKKADAAAADDPLQQLEAMELPKNAKPEQVASFKLLKEHSRKVIEEMRGRVTDLESKTKDAGSATELAAALERHKAAEARATELEQTVERIGFENSPRFKTQFVAAETVAIEGAKAYIEGTEINPNAIELAMREKSGTKRLQILRDAGADAEMIAAISPYLAQYDTVQRGKADALENWKATSQQWEQGQKTQAEAQEAQRKTEEDRILSTVMETAKAELIPFKKVTGHDEWNTQVDKLSEEAKRIFNGSSNTEEVAKTVAAGVAMPVLQKMFQDVVSQLNTLKAENAKLKSAKPGGGITNGALQNTNGNLSAEEQAKAVFNRNLAAARGEL